MVTRDPSSSHRCELRRGAKVTLVCDTGVWATYFCSLVMLILNVPLLSYGGPACPVGRSNKNQLMMGNSGCLVTWCYSVRNFIWTRVLQHLELLFNWCVVFLADVMPCFRTVGIDNIILFLGLARNSMLYLFPL